MDRKHVLGAGGVLLAVLAGGYFIFAGDRPEDGAEKARRLVAARSAAAKAAEPIEPVAEAAPATPPAMDPSRPNDCLIEPSRVVRVNSGVEGVIEAILVERGDAVSRGQVVARLAADVDRASSAAAQARAANVHSEQAAAARAGYLDSVRRRSEEVRGYIARDKVEEAQANARASAEERRAAAQERRVAQLESVRAQRILSEKTVRSPVDGVVTERAMSVGEYRGPSTSHIMTIAQLNPLNVEVFAPIAQLGSVNVGDMVAIFPEEPVGGRYMAQVRVIDRVFDAASGTFGMRLELPNPDNRLPAGLRCRIEINPPSPSRS